MHPRHQQRQAEETAVEAPREVRGQHPRRRGGGEGAPPRTSQVTKAVVLLNFVTLHKLLQIFQKSLNLFTSYQSSSLHSFLLLQRETFNLLVDCAVDT